MIGRVLAFLALLLAGRRRERAAEERIVPEGERSPRAELVVIACLLVAALLGIGFMVVYASDGLGNRTQLEGITLGGALAFLAAALLIAGKHLVVEEELEEEYPETEFPKTQNEVAEIITESGSRLTRKGLLVTAGGCAAGAVGLAAITPALSLGPLLDTDPLRESVWRRGLRLIGEDGLPLFASHVEEETFYTAYPEHADRDALSAPVVVVRLPEDQLRLPPERARWAPGGILAFSKICTHAGCAIALYRKPTYEATQPRPALVCPCHYSTFDPATGGEVIFGPAGRPLPQLPLAVGDDGVLRAGGDYSSSVGPSWTGARRKPL